MKKVIFFCFTFLLFFFTGKCQGTAIHTASTIKSHPAHKSLFDDDEILDFDLSGIVDAPYALPAPELEMNSVSERRYRGYCIENMKTFDSTIAFYNGIKEKIYSLYSDCPLLDEKYKKQTLNYLDEFYTTINDPKSLQKEFGYPCLPDGTGNVIIKGLKGN